MKGEGATSSILLCSHIRRTSPFGTILEKKIGHLGVSLHLSWTLLACQSDLFGIISVWRRQTTVTISMAP